MNYERCNHPTSFTIQTQTDILNKSARNISLKIKKRTEIESEK